MSKKKLTIAELRQEQERITREIAAAETAEKELIGSQLQRLTGLKLWNEIEKNYAIVKKNGGQKNDKN